MRGGVMKANIDKRDYYWLPFAALNFALLAAAVALGFLALISSLEIVLMLAAPLLLRSMGDTVQTKYALVTVRNIWLLAGGILCLAVIIYCIDCFFKRWRESRAQRLYIVLLVVEALIVLAAQALASA